MGEVEFNKILEIINKNRLKEWKKEKSIGMGEGEFEDILEREKREKGRDGRDGKRKDL